MKPILFNTDMVRSILAGRKTVTRRVVKLQESDWEFCGMENDPYMTRIDRNGEEYPSNETGLWATFEWGAEFPLVKAPYQPGQILYVRETWAAWSRTMGTPPSLYYKADGNAPDGIKWHPSIHMPREAARIFLRVTDVRVERLQDIGTYGVYQEGIPECGIDPCCVGTCDKCLQDQSPIRKFVRLWDSTIKTKDRALYGWDANPLVWVIAFERCEKPEGD